MTDCLNVAVVGLVSSCGAGPTRPEVQAIPLGPDSVLVALGEVEIVLGGFGSAASTDPSDPTRLFLLTDRGPNYDAGRDAKIFPIPGFAPSVAVFRWPSDPGERPERIIALRDRTGRPLTGLPKPGPGGGNERALDVAGAPLTDEPPGVDTEGLHVLADGTFWVADEYGPSLQHHDASGRLLRRLAPTGPAGLPLVLARRRANLGFEGLTGNPAGTRLVAVLQAPLDNPPRASHRAQFVRLLVLEPSTSTTHQFLYPLEDPSNYASDLAWLSDESVLVIEHDGRFGGGSPPARFKRVYRVGLSGATDVSDPENRAGGLEVDGRQLEQLSVAGLESAGIRVVAKELLVDLLDLGYPHDKPEGLMVLGPATLGIVNDDDFGIVDGEGALPEIKLVPAGGRDRLNLWVIQLPKPFH